MKYLLLAALSILASTSYTQQLASGEAESAALAKIKLTELVKRASTPTKYTFDTKLLAQKQESEDNNKTRMGILVERTLLGVISGVFIGATTALSTKGADGTSNAKRILPYSIMGGAIGLPIGFVVGGFKAITHKRIRSDQ